MRKLGWSGAPCCVCGGKVNTNKYLEGTEIFIYHKKCLPAPEPGTVEISILRGGSGKWVASKGGVRLGSGHVPNRVEDWESVVVQQLEGQAQGDPDPGRTLGGGGLRTIWISEALLESLLPG